MREKKKTQFKYYGDLSHLFDAASSKDEADKMN